jgi:EAL domain-containing protein (putative c-di-GMP-specific phosphodiesterase class I)
VPPGEFIPVAEDNGLIVPLGIEIFRQVCQFLSTGAPQERGLEYIEVNLSVAQFDQESPADFVQRIMSGYNVDSRWINLEITETASSSAKQVLLKNMNKLIQKGVHFSLDDFGTGRSNLDYFVEMPVNIIKFDYSFIQGYFKSLKARYVVESMVELMRKMGLPVVAEGVETREQLETMRQLGVSYVQGFYFSRPVPKDDFLAFLDENNTAAS